MKPWIRALAVACALLWAAPAVAETDTDEARQERLDDLRHRHLWIAYGLIWGSVFLFAHRSWKRSERTGAELEDLKKRLAALEGEGGGG